MIEVRNIETGEISRWNMDQVLHTINSKSAWGDYSQTDWEEGWDRWVEGVFYDIEFCPGKYLP